jgi:anthranilate phosphoribosyltransferase
MPDTTMFQGEHPFAQYVRILGKGKSGSRNLTREESHLAMRMILADEVEPIQLGAFLMLMRHQEESGAELAGFVDAARDSFDLPEGFPRVDLDWSSYAGKSRRLPWFVLTTWLLACNGVRVLMHGAGGHTPGRIYTEEALTQLGLPQADSLTQAAEQLQSHNFAYLPLAAFLPKLGEILDLKPLLGLRSPVNTFTRLINPAHADCTMQGIHHPGYRDYHQEASLLLGQPRMAVIKGDGGETEWNPDMPNVVKSVINGEAREEEWQPIFARKHVKGELDLAQLRRLWQGEIKDEYGEGAVVGTAAISLYTMGRADSHEAALTMAREMWSARDKGAIS